MQSKVAEKMHESQIKEVQNSQCQSTINQSTIADNSKRIAELYAEQAELRSNYSLLLSENETLKQSVSEGGKIEGDPKDKARIENLRKTNERLVQEVLRLNTQVKDLEGSKSDLSVTNNSSQISGLSYSNFDMSIQKE